MASVSDEMKGEVWPHNRPGGDDAHYGSVELQAQQTVAVRTCQTLILKVTIGEYGLDDTGAIKIVQRWTPDGGALQCDDPFAVNYVTATASNDAELELYCEPYPHQRPWYNGLRVTVLKGYLAPGDTITVVYGDKTHGSPGYRIQTFPESSHEFAVLIDPCATGVFLPIGKPAIEIVAGDPHKWVLTAPTLRKPGSLFCLGIRVEDEWGNPTGRFTGRLGLKADGPVDGLPESVEFEHGECSRTIEGLCIRHKQITRFQLINESGEILAVSNPVVTKDARHNAFWGDLHGQSGETVGINTMREYLEFARDIAFLDVASHQANDFQVTNDFWKEINDLSVEFTVPGNFVVFPGYEWSGNTPVGGDHNVFFRNEGEQIHRSSHALLADREDIDTDARNLDELFRKLDNRDCILFAHVGGRPADISFAENSLLRTAVEVHSDWGTFEWILKDAFELGYRVGLVCNSDGHKGAPGACYPGASEFGAYSGLTCFLTDRLDRDGIFDCMRARHHFGTTGCRMHLEVVARLNKGGAIFPHDPRIASVEPTPTEFAIMGDIATTDARSVDLDIEVACHAPIERVEIFNGPDRLEEFRPFEPENPGRRIRIIWEGAEYRGRGRTTHWHGSLSFDRTEIERFEKINYWNLERNFELTDPQRVEFDAVTTGNFGGCDVWLKEPALGQLRIDTNLIKEELALDEIGPQEHVFDAGGLDRKIRVFRLPDKLQICDLKHTIEVEIISGRDNPIWVKVTTEDGFNAWSSPIYLIE